MHFIFRIAGKLGIGVGLPVRVTLYDVERAYVQADVDLDLLQVKGLARRDN